jgi:hypothetical protein
MINFEAYKENAEERLSYTSSDTPRIFIRALEDIVKLCEYGQKLETENERIKKINPSIKDMMELYTHFICANIFERERLAVQLALRMPEVCLRIQNLEAKNKTLQGRVQMLERQTIELAKRLSRSCMSTVSPETWLTIAEQAVKE